MDDARLQRILRQHVKTDALLGVDAVPMGDPSAVRVVAPPPAPTASAPAQTASVSPGAASDARPAGENLFGGAPAPKPAAPAPAVSSGQPAPPAYHPIDPADKPRLLAEMDANEVRACTKCDLCKGRTQTVFGEGDPNADLMFIGEGPGQTEDEMGRPFVGRAGQLLDKMIVAMGLAREQVFIANIVKCRPPNNRAPTPAESQTCFDYLRRQIAIIQPKVLVALGGPAMKQLIDTNKGVTANRGIWHSFTGLQPDGPTVPVMPTFHPAYLLRSYTHENREKVWSDLKKVMALLGSGSPPSQGGARGGSDRT